VQRIIENWVDRFPKCRIVVTSRTYAYRQDARWRLSKRFVSAELAPFTWKQIKHYIESWYTQATYTRPISFGGRTVAPSRTQLMGKDLLKTIVGTPSLWPLARQPLMLALLTLIHEDHKRLPTKKADLYDKTVELLDRWNIPSPTDKLAEKLANLNLEGIHTALKLIAFKMQKQQLNYHKYPSNIERKELLEQLMLQQKQGDGLGASIEDVLEYLATRNGILVSDKYDYYRFPHLSIQEYLAACALIELYDECPMPTELSGESAYDWVFPNNMAQLMKHDPFRWRNVALFAGSIIASGKGQDSRWILIEELLPEKIEDPIDENIIQCISVASEIWSETRLKFRTRSQKMVHNHLIYCLETIQSDERLDAPERAQILNILGRLQTGL
jgi:predicted NACHT family NTPase